MAGKKSTTTKKTTAKKTDTKKEPAAKDALGCRVGSQSAAINAKITTKPKTVAQLADATGCAPARVRNHLRHLLGKKLIVQTDDGYKTKPAAKRTRKAAK